MTKTEQYRRWLAGHLWRAPLCSGWVSVHGGTAKQSEAVKYWRKHAYIEQNDFGLVRLTAKGRAALGLEPIGE